MSASACAALAERVAAACASCAAADAPRCAGAALGAAARSDPASLDAVLALVPVQRRARLFDRRAFAAAALGENIEGASACAPLPLAAAVRLAAADALLLQEEYLARLPAAHAPALADELLALAESVAAPTPPPGAAADASGGVLSAASAALVAAACGVADAPGSALACAALDSACVRGSPAAWRAVAAAGASARPHAAARRFLLSQLGAALRTADADVALVDILCDACDVASVLDAVRASAAAGAGTAACLARLLARRPESAPAAASACRELAAHALSAGDERGVAAALRAAQTLPSYGAWLATTLADVAPAALRTALSAMLSALPRDCPAALQAQAQALEGLKRQREACADYVGNAKRRRAHLLARDRQTGAVDCGGAASLIAAPPNAATTNSKSDEPAALEAEVQAQVAAFAASGCLEVPPAVRAAKGALRRAWWERRFAPALLAPPAPPPQRQARAALIDLLCAADMLPSQAGAAFRRRCDALEAGGPAAADLAARSADLAPAVLDGPPYQAAAAARALGPAARAALAEAESKGVDAGVAAATVAGELWRAWAEAHAMEETANAGCVYIEDDVAAAQQQARWRAPGAHAEQLWRAAACAACAATSAAVHTALLARARAALQTPGGGDARSENAAWKTAEAAAALLAQMALLRPATLEPVHSWAFAAAAPATWLADQVFPPALRCSDDIAAAARAVAAYLATAFLAAPMWAPQPRAPGDAASPGSSAAPRRWVVPPAEDDDVEIVDNDALPPLLAAVPPALVHRAAWLRSTLRAALPALPPGRDGAAACLRFLDAAFDSQAGRAALGAAGDTPADVARRLDASRFDF